MRRFLEAAWWFLLGAFLMHMLSAYILFGLLEQSATAEPKRTFFSIAVLVLPALVIVGTCLAVAYLKRRFPRAG